MLYLYLFLSKKIPKGLKVSLNLFVSNTLPEVSRYHTIIFIFHFSNASFPFIYKWVIKSTWSWLYFLEHNRILLFGIIRLHSYVLTWNGNYYDYCLPLKQKQKQKQKKQEWGDAPLCFWVVLKYTIPHIAFKSVREIFLTPYNRNLNYSSLYKLVFIYLFFHKIAQR